MSEKYITTEDSDFGQRKERRRELAEEKLNFMPLWVIRGQDGPGLRVKEKSEIFRTCLVESGYDTRRKLEHSAKASVVELTCTSLVKEARKRSENE